MGLDVFQRWVPNYALKNVSLLTIGNFFSYSAGFLYGICGAWILGADGFGQLVLVMALVRFVSLPLNFRLGSPVLKLVRGRLEGEGSYRVRDYVRVSLLVQVTAMLFFGVVFIGLLWLMPTVKELFRGGRDLKLFDPLIYFLGEWFHLFRDWQTALGWFALAEVLQVGRKFVASVFEAYEKFGWSTIYSIWGSLCRDLMVVVFMFYGGVQGACLGYFVAEFLIWAFLVFASYMIWRAKFLEAVRDDQFNLIGTVRELYLNTRSQYVSSLLSSPYRQITNLVIGTFVNPTGVGYYNIALKFNKIFQFLIQPIKTYLFPRFVEKWKREDRREFYYTLRKYFYQLTPVFAVGAGTIMVVAPWLVPLIYSPEFRASVQLVLILMPFFALRAVFNIFTEMSFVVSRQVALVRESALVLLVSLPVNIFLIIEFGYIGAAWGLSLKIAMVFLYRGFFFYKNFGWKWIVPR